MFDGLTFLHCRHDPRCTARVDKRFDGYYTLQLMTRGAVELFYGDRRHEMTGCWFWPCYPGPHIRFHGAGAGGWWEHRYVAFAGPRVAAWKKAGLLPAEPQAVPPGGQGHFAAVFDRLLSQVQRADPMGRLRGVNLLEQVLLELAEQRVGGEVDRPAWLVEVVSVLEASASEEPDYEDLAARVGMSVSTLRRRFREATGCALHTYRVNCRIAAARSLLGETDLPIKAVAERLGYRDVFYFSRQFREKAGTSPAMYRRSRQG